MSIVQGWQLYLSRQGSGLRHYVLEQILFALVGWIPTIIGTVISAGTKNGVYIF